MQRSMKEREDESYPGSVVDSPDSTSSQQSSSSSRPNYLLNGMCRSPITLLFIELGNTTSQGECLTNVMSLPALNLKATHTPGRSCGQCVLLNTAHTGHFRISESHLPFKKRRSVRMLIPDHLYDPLPSTAVPTPGDHVPSGPAKAGGLWAFCPTA